MQKLNFEDDAKQKNNIVDIYINLYPKLFLYASHYVEPSIAKDLIQEIFIFLLEQENISSIIQTEAYLYTLIRNRSLNYIKHENVKDRFVNNEFLREESINNENNEILTNIFIGEQKEVLFKSIRKLSPRCKKALYLRYYLNLNYNQIAYLMKISPRTVETHLRIALKFLKVDLKEFKEDYIGG